MHPFQEGRNTSQFGPHISPIHHVRIVDRIEELEENPTGNHLWKQISGYWYHCTISKGLEIQWCNVKRLCKMKTLIAICGKRGGPLSHNIPLKHKY